MKKRIGLFIAIFTVVMSLSLWNFAPSASANRGGNPASKQSVAVTGESQPSQNVGEQTLNSGASLTPLPESMAENDDEDAGGNDPDVPSKAFRGGISKSEYLRLRSEFTARLRGIEPGHPFDPTQRIRAVGRMQAQEMEIQQAVRRESARTSIKPETITPPWVQLGPQPLPNGQSVTGAAVPRSGRSTAVATDTTNNIIYLGTAQGGVWRSSDGGTTWTAIFDNAASLAIGALAIAPSQPTTLYVGTGEPNQCVDCYFGAGLYRIDNANSASPTIVGPIDPAFSFTSNGAGNPTINTTTFFGRTITKILVHPTDPGTIFVSTSTGTSGATEANFSSLPSALIPPIALVGVYRSTNATSPAASVTFTKLAVAPNGGSLDTPGTGNRRIPDMIMEPGNPDTIYVSTFGAAAAGDGGIFRTTNATTATPTFTQVFTGQVTRIQFAIHKDTGTGTVTVYAATTEGFTGVACSGTTARFGTLRRSVGGTSWANVLAGGAGTNGIISSAAGFCEPQCSYDITVAVDPNNVNNIYLGGSAPGYTNCSHAATRSTDGVTFAADESGVHADTHYIFADQTGTNIYDANDGGIWKRSITAAVATAWTDVNNAALNTLQFQSIAVHPTDRNFTLGGTQDNGTEWQSTTSGTWLGAEGGDGGYALIDQSATDTVNVTQYHTFFCQSNSQILFDRATKTACNTIKDSWPTRGPAACTATTLCSNDSTPSGCDATANYIGNNGIQLTDNVLFYPPMALGPGTPNTLYFGTDRLYRSTNQGDSMSIVSQSPILPTSTRVPITGGAAVSVGTIMTAIAISPQNDNVRLVGFQNGKVWATSTGSSTLVDISPTLPAHPNAGQSQYVGHAVIDPTNPDVAYITLAYYTPAGQGIFKITNLQAASNAAPVTAVWTASSSGIPSIPINAIAIDPTNSQNVFAGTDMGVYSSSDGGATWSPYGTGLPKVAVFDMAIQPSSHILRIATHGRGMWEVAIVGPTAAATSIKGQVLASNGAPMGGITVNLSGARDVMTVTDSNGNYSFTNLNAGDFYVVSPSFVNYSFSPPNRSFTLSGSLTDATFVAEPNLIVTANPIETPEYFVRQQYLDFLGREPDEGGLAYWSSQVRNCGGDADCVRSERINMAAAFFIENEFQQTGSFVYRLYKASYGQQPTYAQFIADRAKVIGGPYSEMSKNQMAEDWVSRAEFRQAYPDSMSASDFVNKLMNIAGIPADDSERQQQIAAMSVGKTRAEVLRDVLEIQSFRDREYNPSFVLMQYFGYLKRDPDTGGYNFWLDVLNNRVMGNYQSMVCAFITSSEYQRRFSSVITRSNAECGQ